MFDTHEFLMGFLKAILTITLIVGVVGTPTVLILYAAGKLSVEAIHVIFPLIAAFAYGLMKGFDLID